MTTTWDLGCRRELFVDPYLLDRLAGASLALHHPQPQEVSITCDDPWEGLAPGYPTVFQDGDLYRMYYRGMPSACGDSDPGQVTCYAESRDGIAWHKPQLGLFEFAGARRNNIVWTGVASHNMTPFRDDRPGCPVDERYKAVGGITPKWGGEGLCALASADGVHWRKFGERALGLEGAFDSQNAVFWDAYLGRYRVYWRDFRKGDPLVPDGRDVMTAESEDFVHWSPRQWLAYDPNRSGSAERDWTDDPSGDHHQFYTNGVLPYDRAPHVLLGFPQRYVDRGWTASTDSLPEVERRGELADKGVEGGRPTRLGTVVTDVLFMASRDGQRFFVWPEAFVRPGPQRPGSWYYGGAWFARGLVQTASPMEGGLPELSLYVQEGVTRDGPGRLRRHTLRLDGFGSLHAPLTGGLALTRPVTFAGGRLEINFSTSAGGRLRVGIEDADGGAIGGFGLDDCDLQYGDQIDRVVSWRGGADVSSLAGRAVRLRIELKDADLFSLRFVE